MNKTEFVEKLHEKGWNKGQSAKIIDDFLECIEEALIIGEDVKFTGFGVFEVKERKERLGRNPKNPEKPIIIPARKVPVFTVSKVLRNLIK